MNCSFNAKNITEIFYTREHFIDVIILRNREKKRNCNKIFNTYETKRSNNKNSKI